MFYKCIKRFAYKYNDRLPCGVIDMAVNLSISVMLKSKEHFLPSWKTQCKSIFQEDLLFVDSEKKDRLVCGVINMTVYLSTKVTLKFSNFLEITVLS